MNNATEGPDTEPQTNGTLSQIGYELFASQLSSVIGSVPDDTMRKLYLKHFNRPNYIQQASEDFFSMLELANGDVKVNELIERATEAVLQKKEKQEAAFWKRYLGTLDVEAWATRPYPFPLKYKQQLEIRRLIPNKMKKSLIVAAKFGDSAVIRLFTTDNAREIGRLPEDITRTLSPLIDLGIANFEATVMMDTNRLSIGDPFYLQIKCYFNNNTFVDNRLLVGSEDAAPPTKKRKNAFNALKETEAEAALRLKQKSVTRLLDRLGLSNPEVVEDADTEAELDLDQLKEFYTSHQQSDYMDNLPDTTTPSDINFKLNLRPYQKQGLSWMLAREKEYTILEQLSADDEAISTQKKKAIREDEGVVDPLWITIRWPVDPDGEQHEGECFYANTYNGELSLEKPIVKSLLKGGILADEMGLGKTISTLSLIHSVPYDTECLDNEPPRYASKSTLIVVPMSLLSQWKAEFDRSNNNQSHTCFVYYGDLTPGDLSEHLCKRVKNIPIVVLTTYGTVQAEWTRLNKQRDEYGKIPKLGIFSVEFLRVVLDEGHNIRNRNTKTAKATHELELRRKWILTGTPVVNRLDDIFSLVRFLRLDPWSNFSYWKTFVTLPFEQKLFHQTLDVVKSILQPIFLRRTKNMKLKDGTPLIVLPEKRVVVEELEFNKYEELIYTFFRTRAYQLFKEGMKKGDLLKKYTQILTHILRMRQICCHTNLVSTSELDVSWEEELAEYTKRLEEEKFPSEAETRRCMYSLYSRINLGESECSICTQTPISIGELTVTQCGHTYCYHCLMDHITFQAKNGNEPLCPDCRVGISKYRLFRTRKQVMTAKELRFHSVKIDEDVPFQLYHYDPDKTSTKIEALISHLRRLHEQSPGEQVVVFSQFSSFLDLIESELKTQDDVFNVFKFDGRLNLAERERILAQFEKERTDDKLVILLLSLKAGGVGLNLTCANRAFMMDPWWSPSIEDQAIDRIHRIGQAQNVEVVRFIVRNSVETKMLRIQERKRMMGEAVEVEEEERRKQRIEEIKLLFDD